MKTFEEEQLRNEYETKPATGVDEAIKLDRKAKLPAIIFTYTFGIIGALVLGVGMCLAMGVIGGGSPAMIAVGIVIGVVGIAIVGSNYPIYSRILKSRKEKVAAAIMVLLNKEQK